MADLVSPGVQVKEKDLTASVRSEPTSIGAFAGSFNWGPMNEVVTVSDESQLVDIFGKPDGVNYEWWFSAANFLAYTNTLRVVRVENTGSKNACVSGTAVLITNTTSRIFWIPSALQSPRISCCSSPYQRAPISIQVP